MSSGVSTERQEKACKICWIRCGDLGPEVHGRSDFSIAEITGGADESTVTDKIGFFDVERVLSY